MALVERAAPGRPRAVSALTAALIAALMLLPAAAPSNAASRPPLPTAPAGALAVAEPARADESCREPTGDPYPAAVSATGGGPRITLPVLVLLDGISVPEARRIVSDVARMYAPMGVVLSPTYGVFRLKADGVTSDGQPTIGVAAALDAVQRARLRPPRGAALVHLLSAKDLLDDGNPRRDGTDAVLGLASCVGGARFAGQQFSVSEGRYRFSLPKAPDNLNVIGMAHEIGHLLGGHHHYGNCSEGRSPVPLTPGSCTAMLPLGTANAQVFGSLERAVIRGYVEQLVPHPSP